MSPDMMVALFLFAFVSSITPGPNNLMLLASGVNFGFSRTLPHMLGIACGFASLLLAVGAGLGSLLVRYPALDLLLKIAGSLYLVYLAWRIVRSDLRTGNGTGPSRPMRFHEAAMFQWVNPKAWVMAITAMAIYADPAGQWLSITVVTMAFSLVNLPCVSLWAGFGIALRRFLADPVRLKWFNLAMGTLLVLSLWPLLR